MLAVSEIAKQCKTATICTFVKRWMEDMFEFAAYVRTYASAKFTRRVSVATLAGAKHVHISTPRRETPSIIVEKADLSYAPTMCPNSYPFLSAVTLECIGNYDVGVVVSSWVARQGPNNHQPRGTFSTS